MRTPIPETTTLKLAQIKGAWHTDSLDLPQNFADMSVFKRLAKAEEQARAAAFLLTEDSSYITGQSIRSDGGVTRSM